MGMYYCYSSHIQDALCHALDWLTASDGQKYFMIHGPIRTPSPIRHQVTMPLKVTKPRVLRLVIGPVFRDQFGLLQDGLGGLFLFVGRIAVFP
jgi:hypothetical protein